MNEIFDLLVTQARKRGHVLVIHRIVKTGKEASVYRATLDGTLVAIKIYTPPHERAFKSAGMYAAGKYYRKQSERKAAAKGNNFARNAAHASWIQREFYLLSKLHTLGASVPQPILLLDTAICMEFLGDETDTALRLHEAELSETEARSAFETILATVRLAWGAGVVHGDLSPYNILWWQEKAWTIDFPQAVDRRTHPDIRGLLSRDIHNVVAYFQVHFDIDESALLESFFVE